MLVPQDIRERKGAFFTPRIWVELSQKYLTDYLGENWQDDYFIWDCAAGTGNLLAGLTNKFNIYASTLDQADVNVMHERIDNGTNLLHNHVIQFDFLNDDFTKLPQSLQDIINDEEKRKKLVIYINPPYAEATTTKTVKGTGENKIGVTTNFSIKDKLNPIIGNATNELFALFMARIYQEIQGCILGQFSTLKFVNGSNFKKFKEFFLAEYASGFVVPAETFDNVKGKFPIGFTIWNTSIKSKIDIISTAIYDKKENYSGTKKFYGELPEIINKWIVKNRNNFEGVGYLTTRGNDFQNNNFIQIINHKNLVKSDRGVTIIKNNFIVVSIYLSVRHCFEATWLNDRDQFLYPNDNWKSDVEFQNDCLTFILFHSQNKITSCEGINHWIPFTEQEVDAQNRFESHFMTDFIAGKIQIKNETNLFTELAPSPLEKVGMRKFSAEATAVFDAGRALWKYYHKIASQARNDGYNVNASFYDIRAYFQGRNDKGRMNSKSEDATYMELIGELRNQLNFLADKIKPKVYEYEFLKE